MGAATVKLFASEGASVIICDLADEAGSALEQEIGGAARYIKTDVRNADDWEVLLAFACNTFGVPDVLVNNAAIQNFQSILEADLDDVRRVIDVNLLGTFIGLKIIGGAMVRESRGSIINISSVDGLRGANGYAAYSTSKWGVRGLTKVAAMEFGPRGVRVNSIHPGSVDTVMGNPFGMPADTINQAFVMVPLQRTGRPEEIAATSLFLASDEASYICGAEIAVDGGWTAGVYNSMLTAAPEDKDYGARAGDHELNVMFNAVFAQHEKK
jgi:3alpha(or 20beta)-hydroxysteroid dehydrogenase